MPLHKVTDFLSEISSFFRKNDAHKAMYSILDVIKWLKMNESTLFGMKSKCNNVYPLLQVCVSVVAGVPGFAVVPVFHGP